MKNGGHQLMNYQANTLERGPVPEWKGAQLLGLIFYFCFSAECGSSRGSLPIWHTESIWQPYDLLPCISETPELEGQPCLKPSMGYTSNFQFPSCSPSLLSSFCNGDNLHTVVLQCGLGCPRDWFKTHKSISEPLCWEDNVADSIFSCAHLNPKVIWGKKTLQIYLGARQKIKAPAWTHSHCTSVKNTLHTKFTVLFS